MININTRKVHAGYFGKIPQYTDFIKHNAGGPEILMIDNWIQQGILSAKQKMKENWNQIYKEAPAHYFIYPFTNTPNLIAGRIEPSYDKNFREYPFIIFYMIPFTLLEMSNLHLLPLLLLNQFSDIDKLNRNDLSCLNDHLASVTNDVFKNEYNEKLENYLLSSQLDFWESTFTGQFELEQFKYNLLHIPKGSPVVWTKINYNNESSEYNLSVLTMLVTGAMKGNQMPAIFWSSSDMIYSIFLSYEPSAIQYNDLLYPDNSSFFNLNSYSKINKIFNDERSLKELLIEINNLRE